MKKTYLIIGSSAAGTSAVSTLLRLDSQCEIVCITKESIYPYNTCLLTSYLAGKKNLADLTLSNSKNLDNNRVKFMLNSTVDFLKPEEKAVYLSSRLRLSYDSLLLSTGSIANLSDNIKQWCKINGVFSFYTLTDAVAIKDYIKNNNIKRAVVVGGGLTGLECVDSLCKKGLEVSLIEHKLNILPKFLNKKAADWLIQKAYGQYKANIYTQEKIKELYSKNNKISKVLLESSNMLETDLVVFALGSKPALELAQHAQIKVKQGIVTSEYLQTSDLSIFAAGDCALVTDLASKQLIASSTWPDAVIQGMVAANNMAGNNLEYSGIITQFSSTLGPKQVNIVICGNTAYDNADTTYDIDTADNYYYIFFIDGQNVLKGFVLMGDLLSTQNLTGKLKKMVMLQEKFSIYSSN